MCCSGLMYKMIKKMIEKIRGIINDKGGMGKFIRYVFVGGSAVIVDFAVFEIILLILGKDNTVTILSHAIKPEKIANTAAVIIGFIYSFILNRTWAFKSKSNAVRQIILMIILLAINTFISNEAISFMGRVLNIPFTLAKPIMQVAVAVWNYFIYDKIIYRS